MYEKLCNIYQILVNEIFIGIESIAQESQKTSPDVVRFQNYHQMNRNFILLKKIKVVIFCILRYHEDSKWFEGFKRVKICKRKI